MLEFYMSVDFTESCLMLLSIMFLNLHPSPSSLNRVAVACADSFCHAGPRPIYSRTSFIFDVAVKWNQEVIAVQKRAHTLDPSPQVHLCVRALHTCTSLPAYMLILLVF